MGPTKQWRIKPELRTDMRERNHINCDIFQQIKCLPALQLFFFLYYILYLIQKNAIDRQLLQLLIF